ncbi:tripartite tricarboxylate transporter TctB family protein [Falsirhodobacter sp. alg1]|uniref:tripartite tricarboxylate transporter TctB family protein n=1 Tax=Falsirhodobacter sp. alg1 TaxID=1472418 RepID=UPI0005F03A5A|nr:tripartite tricarboxylate transporter TctB family protein [Falsirhodobacter sp. alg1]
MQRDYQDIVWGGLIALLGAGIAGYAAQHYDFGSLRRMGPGFFPVILGGVLACLGVAIALPAFGRKGALPMFAWRETLGVIGSVILFGVLLNPVGLILTTAISVSVATSIAPRRGLLWRALLVVAVTVLTWGLFVFGLNMPLPVWPWSN